ncbi:MAG: hypothetical protein ACYTG5_02015 [Planctomycetota bacterium]|jgi:hypothetical protein
MSKITRDEILIDRVIGRDDQPADWRELRSLAADDQNVWKRLLDSMEDETLLRAASSGYLRIAEGVEAPLPTRPRPWSRSASRFLSPLGWIAALAMALLWITFPPESISNQPAETVTAPALVADGEVITELPRVLVSSEPSANGESLELLYMRRILERVQVDELYSLGRDEAGMASPATITAADYRPTQSY